MKNFFANSQIFSSSVMMFVINASMVVIVFLSIGNVAGHVLHQEILKLPLPTVKAVVPPKEPLPKDPGKPKNQFTSILDRNIFEAKRKEVPKPPAAPTPVPPPPSNSVVTETAPKPQLKPLAEILRIELRGTMVSPKKSASYAFLAKNKGKTEKIFSIGECMVLKDLSRDNECSPESVKLTKIENRRVAVFYQDREDWLDMAVAPTSSSNTVASAPTAKNTRKTTNTRTSTTRPKTQTRKPAPAKPKAVVRAAAPKTAPAPGEAQTINLQREWVNEQLANFAQILQDARVVPIQKNGKTLFQFKHIKAGSLYETLGLQRNDIILTINGTAIDNISKAMGLMKKLESEREIALVVERSESPMMLQYFID